MPQVCHRQTSIVFSPAQLSAKPITFHSVADAASLPQANFDSVLSRSAVSKAKNLSLSGRCRKFATGKLRQCSLPLSCRQSKEPFALRPMPQVCHRQTSIVFSPARLSAEPRTLCSASDTESFLRTNLDSVFPLSAASCRLPVKCAAPRHVLYVKALPRHAPVPGPGFAAPPSSSARSSPGPRS